MLKNLTDKETSAYFLNRLSQLESDSSRKWGTMTPQEMLCHCADAFRMTFGEQPCKKRSNFLTRSIGKYLFLNVLPMPKNVATAPELLHDKQGAPKTDWERDKQALIDLIKRFTAANPYQYKWGNHPLFGTMNYSDWGKLAYRHLDHHFRQFGV